MSHYPSLSMYRDEEAPFETGVAPPSEVIYERSLRSLPYATSFSLIIFALVEALVVHCLLSGRGGYMASPCPVASLRVTAYLDFE